MIDKEFTGGTVFSRRTAGWGDGNGGSASVFLGESDDGTAQPGLGLVEMSCGTNAMCFTDTCNSVISEDTCEVIIPNYWRVDI